MKKLALLSIISILFCSNPVICAYQENNKPLIIFHFDMNSVSLEKNYLKTWLKKLSEMGYNAILWEVEDKIKWETCPECVYPDAYSKEEFKDLLNYSRSLGLEPIPLFQTIGHAEYVLKNEKYFPFKENPDRYDCYCTSNPAVRSFIKKWIYEYLELFGEIQYFHIGGDEAYVFGTCAKCIEIKHKIGENGLYADYITDISKGLISKGIKPGIWDDMIMKTPAEISKIPKDFVIWDWNYWDGDSTPEEVMLWSAGDMIRKEEVTESIKNWIPEILDDKGNLRSFYISDFLNRLGYEVITCSASRSHGDAVFTGRHSPHAENIIAGARKCSQLNLLGTCVTSWAVRVFNYEIQEPWIMLAPTTIKNQALNSNELLLTASQSLFGVESLAFFNAISLIGYPFPFTDQHTTGIMWTSMKDSRPAPNGYIKSLIDNWKNGFNWENKKFVISKANVTINQGIHQLNAFIPNATGNYAILNAWLRGGYFQFWQSIVANKIVRLEEKTGHINKNEILTKITELKKEYIVWATDWMTPISAEQNAGLIYDAIYNYFSENNN